MDIDSMKIEEVIEHINMLYKKSLEEDILIMLKGILEYN